MESYCWQKFPSVATESQLNVDLDSDRLILMNGFPCVLINLRRTVFPRHDGATTMSGMFLAWLVAKLEMVLLVAFFQRLLLPQSNWINFSKSMYTPYSSWSQTELAFFVFELTQPTNAVRKPHFSACKRKPGFSQAITNLGTPLQEVTRPPTREYLHWNK